MLIFHVTDHYMTAALLDPTRSAFGVELSQQH